MKRIIVKKSYDFEKIVEWLTKNLPKHDLNNDRWKFEDEISAATSKNGDTLFTSQQSTYIIFKEEKDAVLFMLRWP